MPLASLIRTLLHWRLDAIGQDLSDRITVEGLAWSSPDDRTLSLTIRKLEAASLRLASGPLVLELGRLTLREVSAQLRIEAAGATLSSVQAAEAEVTGLRVQGPLAPPKPAPAHPATARGTDGAWTLEPLAGADGILRAEIVDAHLLFDADVTVPIRQGQVRFSDAAVEHVGPDSRMGVSRLGIYVDAPNGRSYLYQFPSAPVAGVEFEQRAAMLTPWVSDRGKLLLQPFGEALLRQALATHGAGITDQARLLFDRTAVSGQVQLGDGRFAAPGIQADMAGRAQGRNAVQVHSQAVGRGLTVQVPALSASGIGVTLGGFALRSDAITADLTLRLEAEDGRLRFEIGLSAAKLAGLQAAPAGAAVP